MSGVSVQGSCHCGAVRFTLAAAPGWVSECNCSICRRYGVLWSYYRLTQVQFQREPLTDTYVWGRRGIAFHRCRTCGCVTHWSSMDPQRDKIAINARLLDPAVLAAAEVEFLDGANSDD